MFTLGLTGDAAAAHRHEFSSRSHSDPAGYMGRNVLRPPVLSLPPLRAPPIVPRDLEKRKTLPATVGEYSTYGSSDEGPSRSNSLNSQSTSLGGSTSKKRRDRAKTSFRLAHPPPVIRQKQKLRIRPRLLLQLQQLSEGSRPIPALDVLPSTIFAPRLASRFPRAFKGKDRLGTNDLIVVASDSYASREVQDDDKSDSSEEGSTWDHREVVATICQLPKTEGGSKGRVEISFNHGATWEGRPLMNGGYEFVTIDKAGVRTLARWVSRNKARRRTSALAPNLNGTPIEDDKKFTFSIVNPDTRRHPVIASMTRTSIDVSDQYPQVASSPDHSLSPVRSPSAESTNDASFMDGLDIPEQTLIQTDELLRTVIVVTGVWVAFREGWSKNFAYSDAMTAPLSPTTNGQTRHRRHTSGSEAAPKPSQIPNEFDSNPRNGLHHMSDNIRRTRPHLLRRSSPAPLNTQARVSTSPAPPRRSFSTGAAFIEKANRRGVSSTKKARRSYSGQSSGESDDELNQPPPSVSTPKPALRRNRPVSDSYVVGVGTRLPEKKHVQIAEPRQGDATDETTSVGTSSAITAKMAPNVLHKKKDTSFKHGWRRVLRIFGISKRNSETAK